MNNTFLPTPVKYKITLKKILVICYVLILLAGFCVPYFAIIKTKRVSSSIQINISDMQEIAELQVLSITDTQVITENPDDNSEGITAWTEFTGRGDFVVNLQQSEIVVDNVRKTVIIRTPNVAIDQDTFTLEYGNTETLFFHNSMGNDSYREGVDIAQSQYQEAYSKIYDNITMNPYYYSVAEDSAKRIIESLVRSWNKDIPNLKVIVEVGAI